MATTSSEPKHTPPHPQGQTGRYGGKDNEPLFGFVPRMVTAKQVSAALVSNQPLGKHLIDISVAYRKLFILWPQDGKTNPFNKKPYSAQHKMMLEARRKLPVYAQMAEFYEMASNHRPSAGGSEAGY